MDEDLITQAVEAVGKGNLIVYPTDTLYGLGSSISKDKAIETIFSVKNRPKSLPLSIAVSDKKMLSTCVNLTSLAENLAERFLPGKITLVCEKKNSILDSITGGKKTVAVRIPDDTIALHLIKKTGPLIATSANIHGQSTPASISEIRKLFKPGVVEVYIDDGPRQGRPSTIVDVTGSHPIILREGSIPASRILENE
jgi:L-threonylcarbamoyladenylate synthase